MVAQVAISGSAHDRKPRLPASFTNGATAAIQDVQFTIAGLDPGGAAAIVEGVIDTPRSIAAWILSGPTGRTLWAVGSDFVPRQLYPGDPTCKLRNLRVDGHTVRVSRFVEDKWEDIVRHV